MDNILTIGILLGAITLGAIIVAIISVTKSSKNSSSYNNISMLGTNMETIASQLPESINYQKYEKKITLKDDIDKLIKTYTKFYGKFNTQHEESIVCARSLLDNRHFIQEHISQFNDNKNDYYRLPAEKNAGGSVVGWLARQLVLMSGYEINLDKIILFLRSYQKVRELKYKELCALIPMLKIELLKVLSTNAEFALDISKKYDNCQTLIESLRTTHEFSPDIKKKISKYINLDAKASLAKLYVSILENDPVRDELVLAIISVCKENGMDIQQLVEAHQRGLSTKAVATDRIISSLRNIDDINFNTFLIKASLVENVLINDYSNIYEQMSHETKEQYRKEIEYLAAKLNTSELEISSVAKDISTQSKCHIGEAILGEYRQVLIARYDSKKKLKRRKSLFLYCVINYILSIIISSIYGLCAYLLGLDILYSGILAICFIPIAARFAGDISKKLFSSKDKSTVPSLDFKNVIPAKAKTMVMIPVLAVSKSQMKEVIDNLHSNALNNGTYNIRYSLLVDFPNKEEDDLIALKNFIDDEIKQINKSIGEQAFYAFVRKKIIDEKTMKKISWERKRGAILMLNDFLINLKSDNFTISNLPKEFLGISYVITLDEDSVMLPNQVSKMVGAMHHPLNKPILRDGDLVKGVAIMQPKVRTKLDQACYNRFSNVFSGEIGYDRYSDASNGFYMQAFDGSFFYGKGIYQPHVFNAILKVKFPDNTILSHDIIEGGYLGAKECPATIYEGFPNNVFSYYKRQERWLRGDWQLLPRVFPFVRDANKKLNRNTLNYLTRYQIVENIVFGTWALFVILSLILATLFNVLEVFMGFIIVMPALKHLYYCIKDLIVYSSISATTINSLERKFLELCLVPYSGYIQLLASSRAIWRMLFNKKKLLQWSTAAQSNSGELKLTDYFVKLCPIWIVSIFLILATIFLQVKGIYAITLAQFFIFAIFLIYSSNIKIKRDKEYIETTDISFLEDLLDNTYHYFKEFVDNKTGLVCDNYQQYQDVGCAYRTSPTNIGMSLMAYIIACEKDFIDEEEFYNKISLTLETLERMDKFKGHLFNWYDTKNAKPLEPKYISSVDSANLKMSLRAMAQYLKNKPSELGYLHSRFTKLADNMDFKFLYDEKANLFYIGYNVNDQSYCSSHYDLLMSEARQMSFLEVSEGNVPIEHWNSLSHLNNCDNKYPLMVSWGGSCFEYFMPSIFFDTNICSKISLTKKNYIEMAQKYCRKKNIIYGISESAYNEFDTMLNYQYKSFGVPKAGFKRGINSELVSSPYSAALTLSMAPQLSINALKEYTELGALGGYGMYDAVDYTRSRIGERDYVVVKNYMAHHQGMLMCGIYNLIADGFFKKLFMSIPASNACKEMLNERIANQCKKKNKAVDFKENEYRPQSLGFRISEYDLPKIDQHIHAHVLSNKEYNVAVDSRGCSQSRYKNYIINAPAGEFAMDGGIFAFVQDEDDKYSFSQDISEGENCKKATKRSFITNIGSVEFCNTFDKFVLNSSIHVSQDDNCEFRKYEIYNSTKQRQNIKLYLYSEIALCESRRYKAHRIFQNLFLKVQEKDSDILAFTRRPRDKEDEVISGAWKIVSDEDFAMVEFGNDREKFLGRYRSISDAKMFTEPLSMTENTTEPLALASIKMNLAPNESKSIYLVQAVAPTMQECLLSIAKYSSIQRINNNIELNDARCRANVKFSGLDNKHLNFISKMLPNILFPKDYISGDSAAIESNTLPIKSLWTMSISGDNPIVLTIIRNTEDVSRIEHMYKIHRYLNYSGVSYDLVVVNLDNDVYKHDLQQRLISLRSTYMLNDEQIKKKIIILNGEDINQNDIMLLKSVAKCVFECSVPFSAQLKKGKYKKQNDRIISRLDNEAGDFSKLKLFNSLGGFDMDNYEYVILPSGKKPTPMPWSNVLTNSKIGALVSEKGISYMWHVNSRENPITPWRNDPIKDVCPIRMDFIDANSQETLMNIGSTSIVSGAWKVRHGMGYSVFQKRVHNIAISNTVFAAKDCDILLQIVTVENKKKSDIEIDIKYSGNITLCNHHGYGVINAKVSDNVIFTRNYLSNSLNDKVAYCALVDNIDKSDNVIGLQNLEYKKSEKIAFKKKAIIKPNDVLTFAIVTGICEDENETKKILDKISVNSTIEMLIDVRKYWRKATLPVVINTPDEALNALLGGFLLYQVQASRLYGRVGYYQSGGAYGFRDQLQDCLAMLWVDPEVTKKTIIDFASHQFIDGDVQHWWHPPRNGVRTKIRDDMLFLPYVCAVYVEFTGDESILDEQVSFLENVEIPYEKHDIYTEANVSDQKGTILEHCMRAIRYASKFGRNNLPLIGGGDWNDGMNKVGIKGEGESVWLGFFLYDVLNKFHALLLRKDLYSIAEETLESAIGLRKTLNNVAWDGKWFKRGFYDDGTPLGSKESDECKIDCISQSWAVISKASDEEYANVAMDSVMDALYDQEYGLIKLLTPPFDKSEQDPGYIKGYLPGVRENGGQYTHAAIWALWAFSDMGRGDDVAKILKALNPINHASDYEQLMRYKVEPYVMCADIYSARGQKGRGGWTWYTGSASWMYKVCLENVLGIKLVDNKLYISPSIPPDWDTYSVSFMYKKTRYNVNVKNPNHKSFGIRSLMLDAREIASTTITLVDDQNIHNVYVIM